MDVHDKLEEIVSLVEGARAMPMSASCMVNRGELLAHLDELRELLPQDLDLADRLLAEREHVVEEGRAEAERIVGVAQAERLRLVTETEVYAQAQQEAARLIAEAQDEAEDIRAQVDEYVDGKLATFEISLNKTLSAVQRGRDKIRERHESFALGDDTGPFQPIGDR